MTYLLAAPKPPTCAFQDVVVLVSSTLEAPLIASRAFASPAASRPSAALARIVYSWYAGKATAARMPMIATTIIS